MQQLTIDVKCFGYKYGRSYQSADITENKSGFHNESATEISRKI